MLEYENTVKVGMNAAIPLIGNYIRMTLFNVEGTVSALHPLCCQIWR